MKRTISQDEHADLIDELTSEHYAKLRAQLQAGNAQLASLIGGAICHLMTDDICNEQMFYAVMPGGASASPRYAKLVEDALLAQAEIEAIKEVEQMEEEL